jgi:hypothetical protein
MDNVADFISWRLGRAAPDAVIGGFIARIEHARPDEALRLVSVAKALDGGIVKALERNTEAIGHLSCDREALTLLDRRQALRCTKKALSRALDRLVLAEADADAALKRSA